MSTINLEQLLKRATTESALGGQQLLIDLQQVQDHSTQRMETQSSRNHLEFLTNYNQQKLKFQTDKRFNADLPGEFQQKSKKNLTLQESLHEQKLTKLLKNFKQSPVNLNVTQNENSFNSLNLRHLAQQKMRNLGHQNCQTNTLGKTQSVLSQLPESIINLYDTQNIDFKKDNFDAGEQNRVQDAFEYKSKSVLQHFMPLMQPQNLVKSQMLIKQAVNQKLVALRQCYKRNRGELRSMRESLNSQQSQSETPHEQIFSHFQFPAMHSNRTKAVLLMQQTQRSPCQISQKQQKTTISSPPFSQIESSKIVPQISRVLFSETPRIAAATQNKFKLNQKNLKKSRLVKLQQILSESDQQLESQFKIKISVNSDSGQSSPCCSSKLQKTTTCIEIAKGNKSSLIDLPFKQSKKITSTTPNTAQDQPILNQHNVVRIPPFKKLTMPPLRSILQPIFTDHEFK